MLLSSEKEIIVIIKLHKGSQRTVVGRQLLQWFKVEGPKAKEQYIIKHVAFCTYCSVQARQRIARAFVC